MDRKRVAVVVGTIAGVLSLTTAAGAANLGLLRSGSQDPAPAVGNLGAGSAPAAKSSSPALPSPVTGSTVAPHHPVASPGPVATPTSRAPAAGDTDDTRTRRSTARDDGADD